MATRFSEVWLSKLEELVKLVRRQQGWIDVYASVEPPRLPGNPPLLRLEKEGTMEVVPITLPAVQHMMVTGQPGPVLVEIKQAFIRLVKAVERRNRSGRSRAKPHKSFL